MKVSIIIPCFNQSHYLNECLNSVYIQTYKNWECLIINDGSEDNTEDIALNWTSKDVRFRYFYKKNGGLSSARNYGLSKANGVVIQFLDSDDLIEKNKLANEADFLSNNRDIDLVYSSAKFFFNDNPKETYLSREKDGSDWTLNRIARQFDFIRSISDWNIMVVSAPLVKKALCDKVGFFDEKLKSLEDWDYWIRCLMSGASFHYLNASDDALTLIRCYDGSMSTLMDLMWTNELKLRSKYKHTVLHNVLRFNQLLLYAVFKIKKKMRASRIEAIKELLNFSKLFSVYRLFSLLYQILTRNGDAIDVRSDLSKIRYRDLSKQ